MYFFWSWHWDWIISWSNIYICLIWTITEMLHSTQLKVWCEGSFQSLSCFTHIRNECMWNLFFIMLTFKAVSKLISVILIEHFLSRFQNRFIVHSESQCAVACLLVTACTIYMLCWLYMLYMVIGDFLYPWWFFQIIHHIVVTATF